jgi:hypothetical protein
VCGVIDSEAEVACNRQIDKAFFEAALSGSEPDLLHPHSKKELGFLRHCVTALQRSLASHSKKEFAFVAVMLQRENQLLSASRRLIMRSYLERLIRIRWIQNSSL